MAEYAARIEQFRKMAEADPNNELGHFSLGKAYLDGGLFAEAAASLKRCLALNPQMSAAYQHLAGALLKTGDKQGAIERLTAGAKVADARGDVMPRNAMLTQLAELGAPAPEMSNAATAQHPVGEGEVQCKRCGKIGPRLPRPPFRNVVGQEIYESTCTDCWKAWIGMGTKVINE